MLEQETKQRATGANAWTCMQHRSWTFMYFVEFSEFPIQLSIHESDGALNGGSSFNAVYVVTHSMNTNDGHANGSPQV